MSQSPSDRAHCHPLDQALALTPQGANLWHGQTSAAYANMVGPFGGISAAQAMQAVLQHPQRLGEPVALTVNFASALEPGALAIEARPARTNRSTQHWLVEMRQGEQTVLTATAVTALRRSTWSADEEPMPVCLPPDQVARVDLDIPMQWVRRYEMRPIVGGMPMVWDGAGQSSL
ncbi:MAG: acyl-CoA thioesterase, partial [Rhodoferax sp.]